ncbi:glycosyltransferase family 2 protein [Roseomonas marmotae]|uniref:Glycosyltransferase family 2 protein n=1 Tax=Roseomonas marmotae TaxID=2768161 RepID=A0ABS3KEA0_9PROT|nr:glycosyltransferase family 2 protein [Roseomonas marmotae]MBO1075802.1 glycosyltransferase family 2 protein [Roseomonas marmotae]QTI80524.1 glycosyltransferase family 2 protein [Roseomonas marmotae]
MVTDTDSAALPRKKSSVVLMGRAKDEALHLLEWISYHKAVGFDEIVIFSNESSDGTNALLDALANAGIIHHQICHLAEGETPDKDMNKRLIEYSRLLPVEWAALLDIDEYLLLEKHNNIHDFLDDHAHADAIAFNWRSFGSSGHRERTPGLTIERFTRCAPPQSPLNRWVKSIGKLEKITGGGPHYFHLRDGNKFYYHASGNKYTNYADQEAINHDIASIHHYAIRSKLEFLLKEARGDALHPVEKQGELNRYNLKFFESRDTNHCSNTSIFRFISATKENMADFARRAGINGLLQEIEDRQNRMMRQLSTTTPA